MSELLSFIAHQKSPLQIFMEEMHKGAKERQEQKESDSLADYRNQKLAQEKEFMPLKTDLLKAQIENAKQLAANRKANAANASGLTKANLTKNQGIIQSIDNVTPLIDELSDEKYDVPNQLYGPYLHPDQQKNYTAKTAAITDSLISAMGLPKTNESIHLASTMVQRGKAESLTAYRERLKELKKDLANRKQRAHQSINVGLNSGEELSGESNQGQEADVNTVIDDSGNLVEG